MAANGTPTTRKAASGDADMAAKNGTDTTTDDRTLVITRTFEAPRERVFDAFIDPRHLAQWWGPHGFTVPQLEMDVRPGGAYRIRMQSAEHGEHVVRGVYREIEPPGHLVMAWSWEDEHGEPGHETLLTLTFEEADGRTVLTLHQAVFESAAQRDSHRQGWGESLERLAAFVSAD